MKDIKPCPFCGGKAFLGQYQTNFFATLYAVRCEDCNSVGKSCKTEEEAAEAWNRRVNNDTE